MYTVTLTMPIESADAETPLEAVEAFVSFVAHGGTRYVYTVEAPDGRTYHVDHDNGNVVEAPHEAT